MPTVPFKVKAVYDYQSEEPDDLTFSNGQIITVTEDADEDWYTGEYASASGEKLEGIFPRNFVEKYEPAVPTRPTRAPKRAPAPEVAPEPAQASEPDVAEVHDPEPAADVETKPEAPVVTSPVAAPVEESITQPTTEQPPPAASPPPQAAPAPKVAPHKAGPPPVAEKPTSNSFRDRIAAFNKPAAAPVAPFKPAGNSSGFIRKPFVAPPPSKDSYVPSPREAPPSKIYRREDDTSFQREEQRAAPIPPPAISRSEEAGDEEQAKPTSLKDRIAALQKQQLEQAQRHADTAAKKDKPKKPPKKKVEAIEEQDIQQTGASLEKADTNDTVARVSSDLTGDSENQRPAVQRQDSAQSGPTPQPVRELVSDTNDADDSGAGDTEDAQEVSTEEERPRSKGTTLAQPVEPKREQPESVAEDEPEEDETEEEEEDPEVRRKRELRERMAKLGGGMGMMNMFGPPGGGVPPPPRKQRASQEHGRTSEDRAHEDAVRAPPVPVMALPGMSNQLPMRSAAPAEDSSDEEDNTAQPTPQELPKQPHVDDDYVSQQQQPPPPARRSNTTQSSASMDRPVPPPPPETRAVPPPPPGRPGPPPIPAREPEDADEHIKSPTSPRSSFAEDSPLSPQGAPPVPGSRPRPEPIRKPSEGPIVSSPVASPVTRAPPPPPPAGPPSRRPTGDVSSPRNVDDDSDEEVTEYDGDYDTDIASSAKHKDALKSHNRDSSFDDGILTDDAAKSPKIPQTTRAVPPLPPMPAQHPAPPPPPPTQPSRKSTEAPRAAPPPIPPPATPQDDNDDYDPYRYNSPTHGMPTPQLNDIYQTVSPSDEREQEDMYGAATQAPRMPPPPPAERSAPPPPPPSDRAAPPPPPSSAVPPPPAPVSPSPESAVAAPKQSSDVRRSMTTSRRSMDQPRPSGEGYIARDIDLGHSSFWWTQPNLPPPSLANRPDLIFEMEESTSTKRGGRTSVSKDIYILYNDYSRTVVNAIFDQAEPSQVTFEQHHERPPPPARKDELERASETFGTAIASAASNFGNQGAAVGDGSAQGFVNELFRPLPNALRPIGMRAYGALVYANLANASTQQFDEIRPGDIISFRNAKFSGHHGALKQKYTLEAGKPDHVAVVADWDGTKKKIRAWEQRSEDDRKEKKKAKVRDESYRMGDLKSGEVRIWRVVGREYVGWDKA